MGEAKSRSILLKGVPAAYGHPGINGVHLQTLKFGGVRLDGAHHLQKQIVALRLIQIGRYPTSHYQVRAGLLAQKIFEGGVVTSGGQRPPARRYQEERRSPE